MQLCTRVIVADSITNHPHSLLIAFKNDDLVDTMKTATAESADQSTSKHPVICYIKADCSDEIRWRVLQLLIDQKLDFSSAYDNML